MKKVFIVGLLVVSPLLLIALFGVGVYGLAGPADDDVRANTLFRVLGSAYGAYVVSLVVFWMRRRKASGQRLA